MLQRGRPVESLNGKRAVDLTEEDLSRMPRSCTTDDEVTPVEQAINGVSFYFTMDVKVMGVKRITFHGNKVMRKRSFT